MNQEATKPTEDRVLNNPLIQQILKLKEEGASKKEIQKLQQHLS